MSKNRQSILYGVANAVLALLAQQVASGVYPLSDPAKATIGGLLALAITALTMASPFFSIRDATR